MNKFIQYFAVAMFGILIPVYLLGNVIGNVSSLNQEISYEGNLDSTIKSFAEAQYHLETANDYALLAMLSAESANQKTMINKQVMKVTVIQIGFAVISIGLLFVVLGFNDGGSEVEANSGELLFNFKTGSTGLAAIIIGALMATLGGVLKNTYSTVQVPEFYEPGQCSAINEPSDCDFTQEMQTIARAFDACDRQFYALPSPLKPEQIALCLTPKLEEVYNNEK